MSLAEQVLEGNIRAAARLMRDIDDGRPEAIEELKRLYPHTGNAFIIGITGPPGAGKSTLVDQLIASFRTRGKKVGVVAIDPTSPFTGG
ncbi:MAG: ATP/GTP-binding protein, partial [Deltaproteobacteria bacterium]